MRGAIVGDVCASVYEHPLYNMKTDRVFDIPLDNPACCFTDDTVLTAAVADACLGDRDYVRALRCWGLKHPNTGYGPRFTQWLANDRVEPYNSFGNGSAMRVSAIGWLFDTLEKTLAEAECSAAVTHNHPEGIKGAQATAAAIFWARTGQTKKYIRRQLKKRFGYDLDRNIVAIRKHYAFDVSCQGSVPEAIIAFLDSHDFTHALRLAISIGGDSDTIACIAGGIAEAFYGEIPETLWTFAEVRLTDEMLETLKRFDEHKRLVIRNGDPSGRTDDAQTFRAREAADSRRASGLMESTEMKTLSYPMGSGIGQPFDLHEYGSLPAALARAGGEAGNGEAYEAVRLEREGCEKGITRKGLACFLQAQRKWRALAAENPGVFTTDLASSLCNTSNFYNALGYAERREADWAELVGLVRILARENPNMSYALAQSLLHYGLILKENERDKESLAAHEEALPLFRALQQEDARFTGALAHGLNLLAMCHKNLGHNEQVLPLLEEAITLIEEAALHDPVKEEWLIQRGGPVCTAWLGAVLNARETLLENMGRGEEALENILEAAIIFCRLAESNPAANLRSLAIDTLWRLFEGRLRAAVEAYRKAQALEAMDIQTFGIGKGYTPFLDEYFSKLFRTPDSSP